MSEKYHVSYIDGIRIEAHQDGEYKAFVATFKGEDTVTVGIGYDPQVPHKPFHYTQTCAHYQSEYSEQYCPHIQDTCEPRDLTSWVSAKRPKDHGRFGHRVTNSGDSPHLSMINHSKGMFVPTLVDLFIELGGVDQALANSIADEFYSFFYTLN